jgi:DNA-binding MarR family transcriptional regulator
METFGQSAARSEAAAPVAPKGVTFEQLLPFLGAALAIVVLSYLTLQQRQVHLEPQEERLLENETRAGIVKELSVADRIPTDLSVKLGKSKATVSEHLDELVTAGFVERVATPGKKFVFYRLTRKGRQAILRRAG